MRRSLALLIAAALGWASLAHAQDPGAAGASSAPAPSGSAIAYTTRRPAGLLLGRGLEGAFALVGVTAMIAEGQAAVDRYHLVDPAGQVAHDLAGQLAAAKSGQVLEPPIAADNQKPAQIAAAAGGARYVVDVQTTGWGFSALMSTLGYNGTLRVIDVGSGRVVVNARCFWQHKKSDDDPNAPKLESLGDSGAGLKHQIAEATQICEAQYAKAMAAL